MITNIVDSTNLFAEYIYQTNVYPELRLVSSSEFYALKSYVEILNARMTNTEESLILIGVAIIVIGVTYMFRK